MNLSVSSFRLRLVFGALLWVSVGFGVSWAVLSNLLRGHVLREFASELDHHASELAELAMLDPTGMLAIRAPLSDFRFSDEASGYYWQITQADGPSLASASLGAERLPLAPELGSESSPHETRIFGPTGPAMLLVRPIRVGQTDGPMAEVAVAMDMSLISAYVASLENTLAIAMACLATGLILAAFAQIAFALRPLARIDRALLEVKRGEARRMPTDLPTEVRPLVDNLNALLDKNEEMIQRARLQAGNLAHALKTSLAHLQIAAERLSENDESGRVILRQCDILHRQIDHQLARARANASRIGGTQATRIGPVIDNVISAVHRLNRDRALTIEADRTKADVLVACGPEDLEEVLGNLIDNAAKWAASRVLVSVATGENGTVRIEVADDGPGMPPEAYEQLLRPGGRLDETMPGAGLGLAIVHDIVSLYDGHLTIGRSNLGGACVTVELTCVV